MHSIAYGKRLSETERPHGSHHFSETVGSLFSSLNVLSPHPLTLCLAGIVQMHPSQIAVSTERSLMKSCVGYPWETLIARAETQGWHGICGCPCGIRRAASWREGKTVILGLNLSPVAENTTCKQFDVCLCGVSRRDRDAHCNPQKCRWVSSFADRAQQGCTISQSGRLPLASLVRDRGATVAGTIRGDDKDHRR